MNEIWKDINGYNGSYKISNFGRVKSIKYDKEIMLKCWLNSFGYCIVNFSQNGTRKNYRVHRLVAEYFIDNINSLKEVNHIDGNKQNNNVSNLEWCTRQENLKHAHKIGLRKAKSGEEHNAVKLKETDVKEIRNLYRNGYTQKNIAEIYNVTQANISTIVLNKTWKNL